MPPSFYLVYSRPTGAGRVQNIKIQPHCGEREEIPMAKKNYDQMAAQIIEKVGGKNNISLCFHCMTRLRFNLKDMSLIDIEEIKKISGVMGTQFSGDQLQIIIGAQVDDVYRQVCAQAGIKEDAPIQENLDKKKGNAAVRILDALTGAVVPVLPVFIACGLMKAVVAVCTQIGVMTADMPTCQVLTFVGDAGFYFLPILLGAFAAKKFGGNMALGMLIGAMMIHPSFLAAVSAKTSLSVFGLPIYGASYTGSVFPVVLAVFVMSQVEKFIAKKSPVALRNILEPFGTLLIMVPLTLCLIAPIGDFLGTYVGKAMFWLYDTVGFVGVAIFAAVLPLMVITGTHHGLSPYIMNSFQTLGYEPLYFTASSITNVDDGIACIAVGLKTKDPDLRAAAFSAATTALVCGVTEPALFGINLPHRTPLYGCMIGSFVGAGIAGFGRAVAYQFGGGGVFAFTSFLHSDFSNLTWFLAGQIIGAAVTFVATFILYRDKTEG